MRYEFGLGLLAVAALAVVAGCSGGGGSVAAPDATAAARAEEGRATFTFHWPDLRSGSNVRRKPEYVSPSTKSIAISVNGGEATVVNNPTLATNGAGTDTTTTTVAAPVGSDTFEVSAYDATGAGGNLLAQNAIPYTVLMSQLNAVNISLNGNLAKIVCSAVPPYVTLSSAGPPSAFQMVGPAGQIALEGEDADGNIIVAPGVAPAVTLNGPSGKAATSAASSNVFNVNVQVTGTPVPLTASGTNLAGAPVTSTCDVTRVLALYVVNHGQDGANPSVAIYPTTATSASTPTATIAGSNTNQVQTQFIAVTNTGQIYLSNDGPEPGATFGPTSGYVNVYAPGASGNVAPASVMTGFNQPTGLALDGSGNLFLVTAQTVNEYGPGAAGGSSPTNTLDYTAGGSGAADCYGDDVDVNGLLYLACATEILVFPKGATGNASPAENISLNTSETDYFPSWLGVTANSTTGTPGSIFSPTFNNNQSQIDEFAAGSDSTSVPVVITGPEISSPFDIFMDPTGAFYLSNYGDNSVGIFSSATTLTTGLPTESITSGISYPYGVTVE